MTTEAVDARIDASAARTDIQFVGSRGVFAGTATSAHGHGCGQLDQNRNSLKRPAFSR
jgi:hypothetical protein